MARAPLSRRMPTDSSDLLVYACDEASGNTVANSGTTGSADLTRTNNAIVGIGGGVFGKCIGSPGGQNDVFTGPTSFSQASPVTISAWVRPRAAALGYIFLKPANSGWTSPFLVGVGLNITPGTKVSAAWNIGGTNFGLDSAAPYIPAAGIWQHVGMTYDGANVKVYLDGAQAASSAVTGALSWTGTQAIQVGGNNKTPGQTFNGYIDDLRFASVARSADWFATVYAMGMGLL